MYCFLDVLTFVIIMQGLIKSVTDLLADSEHRFCVRHLYSNMNQLHKGEVVKNHLWTYVRASNPARWDECMEAFKKECPAAHAWLAEMPPNTWAGILPYDTDHYYYGPPAGFTMPTVYSVASKFKITPTIASS